MLIVVLVRTCLDEMTVVSLSHRESRELEKAMVSAVGELGLREAISAEMRRREELVIHRSTEA
jgi:hypothetical protein